MKKAVILLSGGLDSTTCLAKAGQDGYSCHALSFSYGQRHSCELEAARKIAKVYNVVEHRIVALDLGQFGGSALTDESIMIKDFKESNEIPQTYVPARNTVFLSIAMAYAETINASAIYTGVSAIDYSHYPDCRPEYIAAFQKMMDLATKSSVEGHHIELITPLLNLSKAQTIELGMDLGVDYSLTVSCYRADEMGYGCGSCDSCTFRKKGFEKLGVKDPTNYYKKNENN